MSSPSWVDVTQMPVTSMGFRHYRVTAEALELSMSACKGLQRSLAHQSTALAYGTKQGLKPR